MDELLDKGMNMELEICKFTPMLFSAVTESNLAAFFDGPVPEVGDAVEMVCYERTPTSVSLKWRVVKGT